MGTKNDGDMCYDNALPDEPMFVLLARDRSAPDLVRKWADQRERNDDAPIAYIGKPKPEHPDAAQIAEARYCAARMEVWRYENDGKWRKDNR